MKKFNFDMTKVTRAFSMTGLKLKKYSPEILVVAGVVGGVTAAVMACKATTKVGDILDDAKNTIDTIHNGMEKGEIANTEYTEEDGKKDLTITYVQTGVKLAKLYGPSVIVGGLSIAAILTSNNIMRKRNLALSAAYMAVDKSFKEYRSRVVERFGKDLDRELRYNIKAKEIEEKVVDENGEEQTVTRTVNEVNIDPHSPYTRCFDEYCKGHMDNDPEANMFFLHQQQNWANERLKTRGYLFLNEVYEALGFQPSRAGQIVGWVYNNPEGDGCVDFGIYTDSERSHAFVNGYEPSIWLDFNVDGNILDLI